MNPVLSAVLGDLTSRFISFIADKFKYYAATREIEIPRLKRLLLRLSTVVMEAEARRVTNPAMLSQLRQLREAMYRGFYMMDNARTPGFGPNQWTKVSNYKLQIDMDNLEATLEGLSEFLQILLHCPPIVRQPYSAYLFFERCMFGRRPEKERIINFLLYPCSSLDVLPVIGPCFVGKRTLVEHVCKDEMVQRKFSRILHFSSNDLNGLAANKHMKPCLSDGILLIIVYIVDDVDVMAWGKLNNMLCHEAHTSKVILISTMDQVSSLGTVEAVRLARLHDEEYWYFFRVLAFGSANPYDHHPNLAAVGNEIAAWINGCFMMTQTITSLLRANMTIQFWSRALCCIRKSSPMHTMVHGEVDPRDAHCSKTYISYFHNWSHEGPMFFCYNRYTTKSLMQGDMSGMIKAEDMFNARAEDFGEKVDIIFRSRIPPCYNYIASCVVEKTGGSVQLGNKCLKRKRNLELPSSREGRWKKKKNTRNKVLLNSAYRNVGRHSLDNCSQLVC